jgi:siderophore synthetase component
MDIEERVEELLSVIRDQTHCDEQTSWEILMTIVRTMSEQVPDYVGIWKVKCATHPTGFTATIIQDDGRVFVIEMCRQQ